MWRYSAVDEAVTIESTGMYYLWFVICDPNLAGVTVSGQTTWKNPGGYLPGMMSFNLPFFGRGCASRIQLTRE